MECIRAAARDEVGLHPGHAETLVHVELVGLDRHLLDRFQPDLNPWLGIAAKLHTAGTADDTVHVVSLGDRRQAIPRAVVTRHDSRQRRDVASVYRQTLDEFQIDYSA